MATLYVRDVPLDLYEQLKERASAEGRSVAAEAVVLLRRALSTSVQTQRTLLDAIKERPAFDPATAGALSSTELLRADRER